MFIVIWIGFAVATALAAQGRGRDFLPWLLIGAATGVFGLIAVLVMKPVEAAATASLPLFPTASNPTNGPTPMTNGGAYVLETYLGHEIEQRATGIYAAGTMHDTVQAARDFIQWKASNDGA